MALLRIELCAIWAVVLLTAPPNHASAQPRRPRLDFWARAPAGAGRQDLASSFREDFTDPRPARVADETVRRVCVPRRGASYRTPFHRYELLANARAWDARPNALGDEAQWPIYRAFEILCFFEISEDVCEDTVPGGRWYVSGLAFGHMLEVRAYEPGPLGAGSPARWESGPRPLPSAVRLEDSGSEVNVSLLGLRAAPDYTDRVPLPAGFGPVAAASFGDAILLHELVHAVRVLEGTNDPSPTPRWYGIDGFEEFCAITVTNMYRSELNRALIMRHARGTERTHLLDPWGDSHPTARLQWERDSLREFVRQQPVFTGLLQNIPLRTCPYNPFAEYLDRGSNRIPVAHATGRRSARCGHDVRGR